ncbi:Divalent Anion:Na+ Symporter [Paratrimastix pyriformis]|uniref:Divalent Anion:Na+ Symporter n=1 Tax=Paratrimastix pyriformis TaxID=342808 RepID=A0ABQ8UB76_9EUKA|nr:Divalent Anion:Na+ Symporter [Paratrimastix pyriformis]
MKFSKQLAFVAVQKWRSKYIEYRALKHAIKRIFKDYLKVAKHADHEKWLMHGDGRGTLMRQYLANKGTPGATPETPVVGAGVMPPTSESDPTVTPIIVTVTTSDNVVLASDSTQTVVAVPHTDALPTADLPANAQHDLGMPTLPTPEHPDHPVAPLLAELSEPSTPKSEATTNIAAPTLVDSLALPMRITSPPPTLDSPTPPGAAPFEVLTFMRDQIKKCFGDLTEAQLLADASPMAQGPLLALKKNFLDLSVEVTETQNFYKVNWEGFRKILKKFRKLVRGSDTTHAAMLESAEAKFHELPDVEAFKARISTVYADIFSAMRVRQVLEDPNVGPLEGEGLAAYRRQLQSELEQAIQAEIAWKSNTILGEWTAYQQRAKVGDLAETAGTSRSAAPVVPLKKIPFALGFLVALIMGVYPWPADYAKQLRCLGILIYASIFWATEAIALPITAMSIPFLAVVMQVLNVTTAAAGAKLMVSSMLSNVHFLVFGGFSIALALQHHGLDVRLAAFILKRGAKTPKRFVLRIMVLGFFLPMCQDPPCGYHGAQFLPVHTPKRFVLLIMVLGFFLSMWISNVAAPVICVSVALPVMRDLPKGSNSSLAHALMTVPSPPFPGTARHQIGGMTTPLASPQNAVAVTVMDQYAPTEADKLTFIEILLSSLPMCLVLLVGAFFVLMLLYKPDIKEVPKLAYTAKPFTFPEFWVIAITLFTIACWFLLPFIGVYIGNEAIVGLIPLVCMFGFNLVPRSDIKNLPWHVVLLVMGGSALGKAVESSKLLDLIAGLIQNLLSGASMWTIMTLIALFISVIANFISHTVAALIILPLVAEARGSKPLSSNFHFSLLCQGPSAIDPCQPCVPLTVRIGCLLPTPPRLPRVRLRACVRLVPDLIHSALVWAWAAGVGGGQIAKPTGRMGLVVLGCCFACTGPQCLPVSSFPNVCTSGVENEDGKSYLRPWDFLMTGSIITVMCWVGIFSIYYGMALAIGV